MYQVVAERFDALRAFFSAPPPNAPMLEAFLDRRAPGRAFVDDFGQPRGCIVAMNYSFVFLGGEVRARLFNDVIRLLRREQTAHVVWPAGRLPSGWAAPRRTIERLEYRIRTADPGGFAALKCRAGAAAVRRIDAGLLPRCSWRDEVVRAAGSEREFLSHGLGFCLLLDGRIVSEAYACFWGRDRLELATITHPDHRGRGYAAAACAHLIEACEGLGFSTYWSCDANNEPSRLLADRLGFAEPRAYRLLLYEHTP